MTQTGSSFITKPSDVQHSDEVGRVLEGETLVHSFDHVIKQAAVDRLGQSIAGVICLFHLERHPGGMQSRTVRDFSIITFPRLLLSGCDMVDHGDVPLWSL